MSIKIRSYNEILDDMRKALEKHSSSEEEVDWYMKVASSMGFGALDEGCKYPQTFCDGDRGCLKCPPEELRGKYIRGKISSPPQEQNLPRGHLHSKKVTVGKPSYIGLDYANGEPVVWQHSEDLLPKAQERHVCTCDYDEVIRKIGCQCGGR